MQLARSVKRLFVPGLLGLALGSCALYDEDPRPIKDPHFIAVQQGTRYGDVKTVRAAVLEPYRNQ